MRSCICRCRRPWKIYGKTGWMPIWSPRKEDVVPQVRALLHAGDSVAVGGSETLKESGVLELLRSGDYRFIDRYAPGLTPEQVRRVFLDSLSADAYLCSANAVTMRESSITSTATATAWRRCVTGPLPSSSSRAATSWYRISTRPSAASNAWRHPPTPCASRRRRTVPGPGAVSVSARRPAPTAVRYRTGSAAPMSCMGGNRKRAGSRSYWWKRTWGFNWNFFQNTGRSDSGKTSLG